MGTLIVSVAGDTILLPCWVCREFGFGMRSYFQDALLPLLLPSIYASAVAVTLHRVPWLTHGLWPLVGIGVTGGVFLGAMWRSDVGQASRGYLERKFSGLAGGARKGIAGA